ncbi:TetR/AcrR family transcriptional regulator [Cohnella sp. AR92]|uniref:TetR/AcrR family transcriptional regulator n=1 Tax=Cohnella sp. AR92 TaxID=648716 RepID=UPI000F8EFA44|nr:TetR family transcriptional regulator [Cohnella sp. AR92]RUS47365.1 TetR/AcrR family transcriptional regulator [Cohnella sp. AR92]
MNKDKNRINDDRDKNREVKDQILRAARSLFSTHGYEGTTVRQICDEAGVSLALVSYHFGGKEKVFSALFDPIREILTNSHYDLSDSMNELIRFCRVFVIFRHQQRELFNIMQHELLLRSPRLDTLTDVFLPTWEQLREILKACAEQGHVEYRSLDMAINFVMGTLMFSLNNPFLNPSETDFSPEEAADLAIGYMLDGIRRRD